MVVSVYQLTTKKYWQHCRQKSLNWPIWEG